MTGKWIEKGKRVKQPGLWRVALTGDQLMVEMELKWVLIVMRASEKRLSPLWPSHFLWPSQCRWWCVSVSVQAELNPLISSGAEADSRPTAHPGVERLCCRISWRLIEQAAKHFHAPAHYLFHDKHFMKWTPAGAWSWKPDSSLIGPRAAHNRLTFLYFFYYLMFVYQAWKWSGFCTIKNGKLWQENKKQNKNKTLLIKPMKLQVLQSKSHTNKVHKDTSVTSPLIAFTTLHLDAEGWFIKESTFPYICPWRYMALP